MGEFREQGEDLFRQMLKQKKQEKTQIKERVSTASLIPTEEEKKIVKKITEDVTKGLREDIAQKGLTPEIQSRVAQLVTEEIEKSDVSDYETKKRIERMATNNMVGLGPIEQYMEDPDVTEIVVQRYNNICVEKKGKIETVFASFTSEDHLKTVINRIVQDVGRQVNLCTPIVDARLANGARVNATIPPVTPDGATLCIRKFPEKAFTIDDFLRFGSLDQNIANFLAACVRGKITVIVSGGTSTGKTTLLNVLSGFIPKDELIVTIEDSCELRLEQPNVRRMETRESMQEGMMPVTTQALVKNALRMRPDRLIVGEIRDKTIVDMISAMSTGHEGSLSTVHANNPANLVNVRMPILFSMHETMAFSEESQAMQIVQALDLIVQIERLPSGKRVLTHITHVNGLDAQKRVKLVDIFQYDRKNEQFCATGYVPSELVQRLAMRGIPLPENMFIKKEGLSNV